MYDVLYRRPTPLVPRGRCLEVPERLTARGEVLVPLDEAAVRAAARRLGRRRRASRWPSCSSSRIRNPVHEQRAAEIVAEELPGVAISVSHRHHPGVARVRADQHHRRERVRPADRRSLSGRLRYAGWPSAAFAASSSSRSPTAARSRSRPRAPSRCTRSNPDRRRAPSAARAWPGPRAADRLISFDMGGTTAKCAIVEDGLVQTTDEYHVDGRPLRIPVIDITEVSAGGGTIAWIDAGGALTLGPQSAGAEPGPVCYALRRPRADRHRRQRGARAHRRPALPRRHDAARRAGGRPRHRRHSSARRSAWRAPTPRPASSGSPT